MQRNRTELRMFLPKGEPVIVLSAGGEPVRLAPPEGVTALITLRY